MVEHRESALEYCWYVPYYFHVPCADCPAFALKVQSLQHGSMALTSFTAKSASNSNQQEQSCVQLTRILTPIMMTIVPHVTS